MASVERLDRRCSGALRTKEINSMVNGILKKLYKKQNIDK